MPAYACAICGKQLEFTGPLPPLYPFCSRRCRLIDLARWFRGEYTIDRDATPEELSVRPPADEPPRDP